MVKYLLEGAANTHMQHLNQLVFDLGVAGTRQAIFFLRDVRDMLSQGTGQKNTVVTTKFDGSPAVFAGINPENGKFFVAKKGLFNKNPKLYYSHADVDADTSGDLADKLKIAFTECQKLGISSGVYQGDIMFTKSDLGKQTIDSVDCYTFHPNTILYAVPIDSDLGHRIGAANIGIVWHTTYTGDSIASLSASFGKGIVNKFKQSKTSWMEDATFKDVTGAATFTDKERVEFDKLMTKIGIAFQRMPARVLNYIHHDPDLLALVHTYNNSKIRAGTGISDVKTHVAGLYDYIDTKYTKEAESKKTASGRTAVETKRQKILKFFNDNSRKEIEDLFELSIMITDAKLILVNKLSRAGGLNTFLKTKNGLRVTSQEGFVAINSHGAVKLVDQMEFSMANFSPEIIKGWDR